LDTILQGNDMNLSAKLLACTMPLLFMGFSASAGPCSQSISKAQAQVDAAIEANAGAEGWQPESLLALRGHQPTPGSLARTEGYTGTELQVALDALNRARLADESGNSSVCHRQLASVRKILRHLSQ
jgi:hypothetical protein